MGGADQWGNITAGLELIRRVGGGGDDDSADVEACTRSGLQAAASRRREPSSARARPGSRVWLDPARTTPLRSTNTGSTRDDRDVGTYLRWFTEFTSEQIEALEAEGARAPEGRMAQRALARDLTARTHGEAAAAQAIADSAARFSSEAVADPAALRALFGAGGGFTFTPAMLAAGTAVLLAEAGLFASRGEARRMVAGGGVTINGARITDPASVPELTAGEWLDVRLGKRRREIGRLQA